MENRKYGGIVSAKNAEPEMTRKDGAGNCRTGKSEKLQVIDPMPDRSLDSNSNVPFHKYIQP